MRGVLILLGGGLTLAGAALALNSVSRHVAGSGGTGAAASVHALHSTLGQPVAGTAAGATHTLRSGYWSGVAPAADAVAPEDPPDAFGLRPISPNPTRGRVSIAYDVPRGGGLVSIAIFDVAGRRVRLLFDGAAPAGRRLATWDRRDDVGRAVSSGIYLIRMRAPDFGEVRKIVLAD